MVKVNKKEALRFTTKIKARCLMFANEEIKTAINISMAIKISKFEILNSSELHFSHVD